MCVGVCQRPFLWCDGRLSNEEVVHEDVEQASGSATMVEYGLLVSVIAILVVGGATTLGTDLSTLYNSFATAVTNAL